MRDLLADVLRADGYLVWEVKDGLELFDYSSEWYGSDLERPFAGVDLIISDIRMPLVTGLEALREFRARAISVPVILITAFGDQRTHELAKQLGAVRIFDKPLDLDEFRAFIRTLIRGRGPEPVHMVGE
jgi:DNA-binding response OmpR family regulator